ncbi:MAG: Bug family tripartite tricarboxylate transporter substrate binding protein [Xanthobacteraceae bacterium]
MSKHRLPRLGAAGLLLVSLAVVVQPAAAGNWPERSVRIITPFGPGISPDAAARTLADALSRRWRQPVVVENRPGADTMLGTQAFLDMHDSHSLLFTTHSTFTVVPLLRAKVPYDPVADARPISLAVEDYLSVAVAPSLEVASLSEFIQLARERPAKINFYAAPGVPYLAYLAFQKRAGLDTTFVPYNSPVNAISDLSEGRIHIAVMPLASVLGAAQAGKIKLLAITNAQRTPAAADVATVAEAGYPEFTFGGFLGLFGPKEMPAALRELIAADVQAVLKDPDLQQRLTNIGLIARGTTPAEFQTLIDTQRAKWSAIAREHHIEPQ